jgi:Concanavalin A-like lectin/glucanases superfamily/Secretion system C-terminal sorting domain
MLRTNYYLLAALSVLFCANLWSQGIPNPEILYYKFDEVGTTVTNYATNPPAGTAMATLMGGVTQGSTGQCNGAIIGSGIAASSDYLNTGWAPTLNNSTPWTLSFWTSDISPSSTLFYIFGDINSNSFRCFTNGVAGPNNWILRCTGMTDVYVNGAATVAPTMTTFTFDPTTMNIKGYMNGVLVTTVAQTAVPISGTGPFKVCGYGTNVGLPSGGKMDEFRLYDRVISDAEIMQLYTRSTNDTIAVTSCGNYTSPSGNYNWTTNGTYFDTIPNSYCGDSLLTINLTIAQHSFDTMDVTTCDSYNSPSGNFNWTTSGTYYDTIPNAAGCDSLLTINLTINNSTYDTMDVTVCESYDSPSGLYSWTTSGTYYDTIPNMIGCDSLLTINLTVNYITSDSLDVTACDSMESPSGNYTWTSSGIYYDTIANAVGCDSLLTINLTIVESTTSTISPASCGAYTAPDGATYTASGTYSATIENAAGCDSVITIVLTYYDVDTNLTVSGTTITAAIAGANNYQWVDCATQTPIAGATSQSYTATANGDYAVMITNGPCPIMSECATISNIGIDENGVMLVTAYPNPVTTALTIVNADAKALKLSLLDQSGREISSCVSAEKEINIDMKNLATGLYILKVSSNGSEQTIKVIRN